MAAVTVAEEDAEAAAVAAAINSSRTAIPHLGLGAGWRPELALAIERRSDLGFVEITAENFGRLLPAALMQLREHAMHIVPHGISLSLGGAERPSQQRLDHLAFLAESCGSPLVSEHIAFVRAGDLEAGHLMPVARTRESLELLIENVQIAQRALPVPLALENISALFDWPDPEYSESVFLRKILDATGAMLLLDVSNVYANAKNLDVDPIAFLSALPLDRIAYVHVGGGYTQKDGTYADSHSHPVAEPVFLLLQQLCSLTSPPGIMLERDDNYATDSEWNAEMDRIAQSCKRQPANAA